MTTHQAAAKRVLLLEDEDRLRGIMARYLRARGHEVIEARSADEARALLQAQFVHTMLLDVNLAGDTCWDLLRWVADWSAQAPSWERPRVVVLSAVPPSPKRIQQFKPDAILNKPFPIDALGRLVESDCVATEAEHGFD